MSRTIDVCLGDEARLVGRLRYDQQGSRESAAFEYDATWLAAEDRFALEPGLALVTGPQYHRKTGDSSVFHPAIADTEPDGWARRVIQRDHAKRRQDARRAGEAVETRPLNALDFLLAVDDFSRIGAIRMRDETGVFRRTADEGQRGVPPLIEIAHLLSATRAVETNTETAADLAYLRGRGTSLGGLRPKCSVLDAEGRLARMAGIDAAHADLIDSDGSPVALIRRFDRPQGGGRLMYVSAATMLGADPGDAGEHAYTELVDALRQHGREPQADIEELWRRIAFSILITNVDDHLMNHGFLHVDHGQWRLAPAFDINPFPDRLRELKTWVSEDTGPEATIDALMSVTAYFRISGARAKAILAEVETAVASWMPVGRALGMSRIELDAFADAFEHAERGAAQRAVG